MFATSYFGDTFEFHFHVCCEHINGRFETEFLHSSPNFSILSYTSCNQNDYSVRSVRRCASNFCQDLGWEKLALLGSFNRMKKVTLRELQSLIGVLSFACKCVVTGRPFLCRLMTLTTGDIPQILVNYGLDPVPSVIQKELLPWPL